MLLIIPALLVGEDVAMEEENDDRVEAEILPRYHPPPTYHDFITNPTIIADTQSWFHTGLLLSSDDE